jgi:hypothetical protein
MNKLIVTIDVDWACEAAIEDTLDSLDELNVLPTIFVTHRSPRIEASLNKLAVGLHPYFGTNSSHGSNISQVVEHILGLPHNFPAFRCHRFAICNSSRQAMVEAGMIISSNICTDLEIVAPFKDRFGLLEVPIFMEDGGYLWRKHSLEISQKFKEKIQSQGLKVITLHPMHFAINTPNFEYMYEIKQSMSREEWIGMSKDTLNKLRRKGRGIRDLILELIELAPELGSFNNLIARC